MTLDNAIPGPFAKAFEGLSSKVGRNRLGACSQGSRNADLFMNTALALLKQSRLAAAVCGDKSALGKREPDYYTAFYEFADKQPDLAVVRIFGKWSGDRVDKKFKEHNDKDRPNVLGLLVGGELESTDNLMATTGTGLVLLRGPLITTALLHWGDRPENFAWTATSDPLVTTVLLDEWSALSKIANVVDPEKLAALAAFRRRFGMAD